MYEDELKQIREVLDDKPYKSLNLVPEKLLLAYADLIEFEEKKYYNAVLNSEIRTALKDLRHVILVVSVMCCIPCKATPKPQIHTTPDVDYLISELRISIPCIKRSQQLIATALDSIEQVIRDINI
jgi:hypothetical protein